MTSTKRLYLAPDAPYPYENDHYLVMDKVGSESAVKILASSFLSEVVEARDTYATLDDRLDALVVSGGNVASKTNGVSAAGQKVITVDSTTGFIVGSYVVYYLNGTTLEGNVIASIQAGVSLTMTNNIGASPAGGVLDDTPISMISVSEYIAAQAIPHAGTLMLPQAIEYANGNVFNVRAYGAKADAGDDTAAFVAAFAAAGAAATPNHRATVTIPAGLYMIDTGAVIVTNPYVSIKGDGMKATQIIGTGVGPLIQWAPTSGAYTGVTGTIEGLMFAHGGDPTPGDVACIEVVNAGEVMIDSAIRDCWFANGGVNNRIMGIKGQMQAVLISDCIFENIRDGIVMDPNSANSNVTNCLFYSMSNTAVSIAGTTGTHCYNINISDIVFPVGAIAGTNPAAVYASYTDGLNVNNLHCYNIDNSEFLLSGLLLTYCNRVNLSNLHFKNVVGTNTGNGGALNISNSNDVNVSNLIAVGEASYRPAYGVIATNVNRLHVSNFTISGALRQGVNLVTASSAILHAGTIAYTGETDNALYAGLRFTGPSLRVRDVFFVSDGTHSDYAIDADDVEDWDEIIVDGGRYDSIGICDTSGIGANPHGKVQIEKYTPLQTLTADSTSPSVIAGHRFRTANTTGTRIFNFAYGYEGQQITVIIADAHTTIGFAGTNLKGNGGADWSPGSGDWLEAFFDGTNWYCSVHDCTA